MLFDPEPGSDAIDAAAATQPAGLGVTNVPVVRDDAGIGVGLEGWAFDPLVEDRR